MKQATFITKLKDWLGDARLYQLSEPHQDHEYVVVSGIPTAFDTGMAETYIFGSTIDGDVMDWHELTGSFRGAVDHAQALAGAGYTINP